jgi:hypothetical protein
MKFTWDPKNKKETDLAEKIHRHAVEKPEKSGVAKATAVKNGPLGKQSELKKFDPKAGELVLIFP